MFLGKLKQRKLNLINDGHNWILFKVRSTHLNEIVWGNNKVNNQIEARYYGIPDSMGKFHTGSCFLSCNALVVKSVIAVLIH